jgi:transposase
MDVPRFRHGSAIRRIGPLHDGDRAMSAAIIGLDLAKSVFQVHGVDVHGKVVVTKRLRRDAMLAFFANLAPCVVGMEACAGSHF